MAASVLTTKGDDDAAPPPHAIASNNGVLPTDMLREVLLRLPADELCRLRLVCRSWRSLTSDPLFAMEHSSSHDRYVVALHVQPRELHVLDLYGTIIKRISMPAVSGASRRPHVFHLSTGAAAILHRGITSTQFIRMMMLCPPKYVLGYVPATQEYKMLCVVHSYGENLDGVVQPCHVMTLAEIRWRRVSQPPFTVACGSWKMACVGGIAYFLVSNIEMDSIALFDFVTEEWRPKALNGPLTSLRASTGQNLPHSRDKNIFNLSRLSGCLVVVHKNCYDCSTDLWFLDHIEMSLWTKRYSIPWTAFNIWQPLADIYPILVLEDGRIVVWLFSERILRAYNPRTSTWTEMAMLKDYSDVGVHHGSLLCSGIV